MSAPSASASPAPAPSARRWRWSRRAPAATWCCGARDARQIDAMRAQPVRTRRIFPASRFPPASRSPPIRPILRDAELVLLAVPAQATRAVASALAPHIARGMPRCSPAPRGSSSGTGLLQSASSRECLPGRNVAALSGPGFAEEIARGLPTAVTIAADDIALAHALCAALSRRHVPPLRQRRPRAASSSPAR